MENKLQNGASTAINTCLSVTNNDRVIIVSDIETYDVGKALEHEALKLTSNVLLLKIEDYILRPADSFSNDLKKVIEGFNPNVSIYAAQAQKGELPKFRRPLITYLVEKLKCRHAHMVGITKQLMEDGMNQDYDVIYKITHNVYNKVTNAKFIHVKDVYGTDISYELDAKNMLWIPDDGKITIDNWSNLPSGEVFTSPLNVNGTYVGWVLGDYLSEKYGVLKNPIKIVIKDSLITNIEGDESIKKDFEEYVNTYENGNKVGELGIGTLVGLTSFTGNLLQDEKYPGVHMAFGNPYPEKTHATWTCESHIDVIAKDTTITVEYESGNMEVIMRNGKYLDFVLD